MKIRRVLATAVAVAATTPAVLLSVTPAFADASPMARTQAKPTLEELEKAAAAAQEAYDKALAAKTAAADALAKAREEEENENQNCVAEPGLTTVLTGVPDSITAGTTTALSLRVSNRSGKTMDNVLAYTFTHATDTSGLKETDRLLHLQWSTASSPKWHSIGGDHLIDGIGR
ncbi:hypothetical protein [Streptomyces sp. ITFR-6]|uniref:hypothetical protein n=1 Tax=Streptomyces sp. ITFR-6 TaxID=3075197 RepID=UPI00288B3BE6|nr:hypothetical protein [Streptomyces sp. ITFR-6]WNI30271.1 hypothetical protein RLT59_16815 [Streptomyces sp. ITFR-6]